MASKFNHANFAIGNVSGTFTAIATTINLSTGHGNRFPTAPFRVTLWNSTDFANPAEAYWAGEAEIIECGSKTANSIATLTRGCEGTSGIASTAGKVYRITNGFSNADLLYAFTDVKNVVSYGAIGDGNADDTDAIQDAIDACPVGGTVFLPNGTYKVGKLTVVKSGLNIVGESPQGTILSRTLGTPGTYTIDVDLTSDVRPFDFSCSNFSIQGDTATRPYGAFRLKTVRTGTLENIYIKGVSQVLMLDQSYWTNFRNWYIEHYTIGITGYDAEGGNSNNFDDINFFDGNVDGTAMPLDTTWMNANTFRGMTWGCSDSYKMTTAKLLGSNGNLYIGCRFETVRTPSANWMRIGSRNQFLGCTFMTQVVPTSGYFALQVEGSFNYFKDLQLDFNGPLLKLETTSSENEIHLINTGTTTFYPIYDYGSKNVIHYGKADHIHDNKKTWSEISVTNLFTTPTTFAGVTTDELTKATDSDVGPHGYGNVYKFHTPTGNKLWKQSIGSIGANLTYTFSIWAKAVSGTLNKETIGLIFSEVPTDKTDFVIRDDRWTRLVISAAWGNGPFTRYVGVILGAASSGVLLYGPQVVYNGPVVSSVWAPVYPGSYSVYDSMLDFGPCRIITGSGDPEGVVTAPIGSLYLRTDGTTDSTLYIKEGGTGNTGWIANVTYVHP